MVGLYAKFHPLIYRLAQYIPGSGASARGFLMNLVRARMQKRSKERTEKPKVSDAEQRGTDKPQDFVDKISEASEKNPQNVTPYHVFMMGFGNVVAGSDTTGTSLSAVLFYLTSSPRCLQALRAEIENCQDDSGNKPPTFEHLQKLPYLQAVIKESLCMHPATGLQMWRTVPKGGAEIQGVFFPENSVVGLNSWTAHYDEKVFDKPHEFRPERWLPNRRKTEGNGIILYPIGMGSRTCIGRHISTLEMIKLIPQMEFDFELQETSSSMRARNHWFVKPDNLKMRVRLRSHT
uniref:Cytochrome P450 n=1 Tax=Bionectria ochroleuca TaxID=29856 RepID=A0A0B7KAF3_BIOOC